MRHDFQARSRLICRHSPELSHFAKQRTNRAPGLAGNLHAFRWVKFRERNIYIVEHQFVLRGDGSEEGDQGLTDPRCRSRSGEAKTGEQGGDDPRFEAP